MDCRVPRQGRRTLHRSFCIDAPHAPLAKLIPGSCFAEVVVMSERVMSERSPEQIHEQIRELLDSLYRVDSGRILATLIRFTLRPACSPSHLSDLLHRRLRRFRFLHRHSDCFRVERTQFPGGTFTRSRPAPFHGARLMVNFGRLVTSPRTVKPEWNFRDRSSQTQPFLFS
jgi:hypothetical protein